MPEIDINETQRPPWHVEWPLQDERIREVFDRCWRDGSWGRYHGDHCEALRIALAEMYGVEHVILCSSGTAAVELALRATALPALGDPANEVVLCSYDFKANFQNVLTAGGFPVLVDCLPNSPCIDTAAVARAIGPHTRCIIASHLHGCIADIEHLRDLSRKQGILLIEDACQTPAAMINGQRTGSFGDLGVLSFGGSKLLTAGRGGAVLCHDPLLAQRIRLYVQRGNDAYPLSELQAALILPQLQSLDLQEQTRRGAVDLLQNRLRSTQRIVCLASGSHPLPGSHPASDSAVNPGVQPPHAGQPTRAGVQTSFYKVPFLLCAAGDQSQPPAGTANSAGIANSAIDRTRMEAIAAAMRKQQIPLDPAFTALHLTHSQRRFRTSGTLRNAECLHHRLMVLHHPVLLSPPQAILEMATAMEQVLAATDL